VSSLPEEVVLISPHKRDNNFDSEYKAQSLGNGTTTPLQILYIVTSLDEFDDGNRGTIKNYDRFSNLIVPIIRESVTSMISEGYQVDLYLLAHYEVNSSRKMELRDALPKSVHIDVWGDATPWGYEVQERHRGEKMDRIKPITRSLARQHRFVIKEKFFHYDFFMAFEDDMLVKSHHVKQYLQVSKDLENLRKHATSSLPSFDSMSAQQVDEIFHGPMTSRQLERMIPGFIRVEAALPSFEPIPTNKYEQVPVDYAWDIHPNETIIAKINPSICCHVTAATANDQIPLAPKEDQILMWETSLDVLGVRKMPPHPKSSLDWVLMLMGPKSNILPNPNEAIGQFWSGKSDEFFHGNLTYPKDPLLGRYVNNQGGWMATQMQIAKWHNRQCKGGFLPPYDSPFFTWDGLDNRSVEYWSGGVNLFGVYSCRLQRIIPMDPTGFSKHLLYHASNNKQRSVHLRSHFTTRNMYEFYGQLNAIRKSAHAALRQELQRHRSALSRS
jgi:hypothetical protein